MEIQNYYKLKAVFETKFVLEIEMRKNLYS